MSLKLTVKQIQELPEGNESYPSDLFCMVKFGESMQKFETDMTSKKRVIKIDSDAEFNIQKEGGTLKCWDFSLSSSQWPTVCRIPCIVYKDLMKNPFEDNALSRN